MKKASVVLNKHKIKTIGAKALEKNLFLFFLFFFFFYQPVKSTLTSFLPFLSFPHHAAVSQERGFNQRFASSLSPLFPSPIHGKI